MSTLKLYSTQSNGVTYSDPMDPDYQVRFKTTSSPKNLDGQRVQNFVTEIAVSDTHDVEVGNKVVQDTLSVRLRISGAGVSVGELKKIVADLAAQVNTWASEDVLLGFNPETAPVRN